MKKIYSVLFLVAFLIGNNLLNAATFYSRTNGNWTTASTWSTVSCGGVAATSIPTAADNVIICSGNTITMNGNSGVCLSLTVNGTATWTTNGRTTNVGAGGLTINNGGTLSGTSTGVLNVSGAMNIPAGALATVGRLTITVTGQTTVSGTLRFNSTIGTKTFGNVVMNSGSVINSTSGETYNINGNLSMAVATITGTATGRFNVSGTFNVLAGASTVNAGTLRVTGLSTISGTLNIGSTAGTKTFGDFTIASGGLFNNSSNENIRINGNYINNGSIAAGTGTYNFAGAGKTISGTSNSSFARLNASGSYTNNGTVTITNTLSGNSFSQGTTGILFYNGPSANLTVNTFNASATGNIVSYGMGTNYNIVIPSDGRYYHLTVTGGATKSLNANTIVSGNLLISAGTTLNAANRTLSVGGNFTNNNVFTQGTSTVILNGISNQTIGGTNLTTFNNLTINNTAGVTLAINTNVGSVLTFTNGVITTNANKVTINVGGSVAGAGTGKFVNGYLEKNVGAGTNVSRTYEVGSGSSHFLPLVFSFANVSTAGKITVRANNGDHGNIATSCIDETKSVNRNWELINSGTVFTTYSATCTFMGVPTDGDAGSISANYYMALYNGSVWTTLTRGAVTATTNQATGITNVGYLQIGERRAPVITTQPVNVNVCGASAASFVVVASGLGLTYQWQLSTNGGATYNNIINGGVYSGATTATLNISNTAGLNNNRYRCIVSSSCSTSTTSNAGILTTTANAPASVAIVSSLGNTICAGVNVTFTATPTNGGANPSYQWKINGSNVGTNAATFSTSSLVSGNIVSCVMTSNLACATGNPATSNSITMTVNPNLPVSITIVSNQPGGSCSGNNVIFTATPANAGTSPTYQWKLNGGNVGANSATYSNSSLSNGDVVSCVLTSNAACTSGNPATSNSIIQSVTANGTWLGATSSDWSDALNWCGGVPVLTSNIQIPSGTTFSPILSAAAECNNINISATAFVDLNNNELSVYGAFSGTGNIIGSASSSLVFEGGSGSGGTFFMDQTSTGSSNSLSQLIVNRSSGTVTIGNSLQIYNLVSVLDGTLASGNNLTLLSNASATARVGELASSADITGNVTVQRYIPAGADGWMCIAAPVSGAALQQWDDDFVTGGFSGSQYPTAVTGASIVGYDESLPGYYDDGYVDPTGITDPITPRVGYWAYVLNTPLTIDVTGPILKKTQTFPVTYTDDPAMSADEDGWNLIANPYPSTIDWDAVGWTKTNIADAVYCYSADLDQYTTYIAGIGTNGGSNLIASSQAFLVQTTGISPVLRLDETVKSTSDAPFLRTQSVIDDLVKLNLNGNNYSDETFIRFNSNATSSFDLTLDAKKFYSFNYLVPGMATISGNTEMAVNSLPLLNNSISIPLKVIVGVSGNYTINIDTSSRIPQNTCLVLEDLLTGVQTDLRVANSYTFYIQDTTSYPRFVIHFGGDIIKASVSPSCSNLNDGYAYAKGVGAGPFEYTWLDPSGQVVQMHSNIMGADTLAAINGGVYTVQITGNTGGCYPDITTEIDVAEPDMIVSSVSVMDASCQSLTDGAIVLNSMNGGVEPLSFAWSNGVVTEQNTSLAPGSYTLTITDSTNCMFTQAYVVNSLSTIVSGFSMSTDTIYLDNNSPVLFIDISSGATSYSWDFGDGSPIDNSINPSHLYSMPGTYNVMLIVSDGSCSDTLIQQVVVMNSLLTSVDNGTSANAVQTINNGSLIELQFNFEETSRITIHVFNALGQEVFEPKSTMVLNNRVAYNFLEKAKGLYYFKIIKGADTIVKKVIND